MPCTGSVAFRSLGRPGATLMAPRDNANANRDNEDATWDNAHAPRDNGSAPRDNANTPWDNAIAFKAGAAAADESGRDAATHPTPVERRAAAAVPRGQPDLLPEVPALGPGRATRRRGGGRGRG